MSSSKIVTLQDLKDKEEKSKPQKRNYYGNKNNGSYSSSNRNNNYNNNNRGGNYKRAGSSQNQSGSAVTVSKLRISNDEKRHEAEQESQVLDEVLEQSASGSQNAKHRKKERAKHEEYISQDQIQAGLEDKTLVKGILRINAYNRKEAYVVVPTFKNDVFIDGEVLRNRALDRDEVIVSLFDKSKWKKKKIENNGNGASEEAECFSSSAQELEDEVRPAADEASPVSASSQEVTLQPTGKVVAISQRLHQKEITGYIRSCRDNLTVDPEDKFAIFVPLDKRYPKMIASVKDAPLAEFIQDPVKFSKNIFVAKFIKWNANAQYPIAFVKHNLGKAGDIEAETAAALVENGISHVKYFGSEIKEFVSQFDNFSISQEENERRRDLRKHRIFTIDPESAKDLDDAMSITRLPNGRHFEVGIHIADVSHFVTSNTILDKEAERRATSVYLVNKVVPMLPSILSEDLCSLNPGQDRLAFSVIATIDEMGELVEDVPVWYGKTVIQSCAKLSYSIAQSFIDEVKQNNKQDSIPAYNFPIHGDHKLEDIKSDVAQLFKIMKERRRKRLTGGALQIKEEKLVFTLDENNLPVSAKLYELKESNNTVEEMMLLANFLVARKLVSALPDFALLRRHGEPLQRRMTELVNFCSTLPCLNSSEIRANSTASELNAFLESVEQEEPALAQFLHHLARKSMQTAKYICAADEPSWHHYALHLPYYTHFTSPIRRYADLMVHRLLQFVLQYERGNKNLDFDKSDLQRIIEHCNRKRTDAQRVQEVVNKVYLTALIQNTKPATTFDAIVMGVSNRTVTIFIPSLGIENRIYIDSKELKEMSEWRKFLKQEKKTQICWGSSTVTREKVIQTIQTTQRIKVSLAVKVSDYGTDFIVTLPKPEDVVFTSQLNVEEELPSKQMAESLEQVAQEEREEEIVCNETLVITARSQQVSVF